VAPVFEELADEYCTKIKFAKLDIDDNQRLAGRYQIKGIPTFIVFVNGEEKLRLMGHKPKELFVAELSEWLEAKSLAK
jgi:thioredoxin 1